MRFYGEENDRFGLCTFYEQLCGAWCVESCSPSLRGEWSPERAMAGQCFVTAILVQEHFGGEVYETHFSDASVHYFNKIEGTVFDLTSGQFAGTVKPSVYAAGIRTDTAARLRDPVKMKRCGALRAALRRGKEAEHAADQPCL